MELRVVATDRTVEKNRNGEGSGKKDNDPDSKDYAAQRSAGWSPVEHVESWMKLGQVIRSGLCHTSLALPVDDTGFCFPRNVDHFKMSQLTLSGSTKAITDGDARNCSNTARLFYSATANTPKVVWSGHQELNGLGITIFGWSHGGTLLLFQTRTWPYDSDADEVRRGLVFDSATGKVRDLKLDSVFTALFGSKCEFAQTVLGWESDHSIKVRISKTPLTDHYEQVFCVKVPIDYTFDLSTRTVTRVR